MMLEETEAEQKIQKEHLELFKQGEKKRKERIESIGNAVEQIVHIVTLHLSSKKDIDALEFNANNLAEFRLSIMQHLVMQLCTQQKIIYCPSMLKKASLFHIKPTLFSPNELYLFTQINVKFDEVGEIYETLLGYELYTDGVQNVFGTGVWCLGNSRSKTKNNERSNSASYYTPDSLSNCIMQTLLPSWIEENPDKDPSDALLLEPSVGSANLLMAAINYIAKDDFEKRVKLTKQATGVDLNIEALIVAEVLLYLNCMRVWKPNDTKESGRVQEST